MWTMKIQMFKLVLEKVEEPEIKLPTSVDHWKINRVPEKYLLLLYWLCQSLDCVDHIKLWKILQEMGIPDHPTCLLRNLYAGQEATVKTGSKLGKEYVKAVYHHPAYLTYMQSTSCKCQAGCLTRWSQDCPEKHQQPQICRWYHSDGRKQRGTKEPLDEDERG